MRERQKRNEKRYLTSHLSHPTSRCCLSHIDTRQRLVGRRTKLGEERSRASGPVDVPNGVRRPENGGVEYTIAVVIARGRHIAVHAPRKAEVRGVFASQNVPKAIRRPEDRHIRFAVARVV